MSGGKWNFFLILYFNGLLSRFSYIYIYTYTHNDLLSTLYIYIYISIDRLFRGYKFEFQERSWIFEGGTCDLCAIYKIEVAGPTISLFFFFTSWLVPSLIRVCDCEPL